MHQSCIHDHTHSLEETCLLPASVSSPPHFIAMRRGLCSPVGFSPVGEREIDTDKLADVNGYEKGPLFAHGILPKKIQFEKKITQNWETQPPNDI